jgi:hemoglobin
MSHFERIGGEEAVRRLVDRFYDLMDTLPEAKQVRDVHPPQLTESREKLHLFLVGWLGGPALYVQKFGHPRLRARHLPFPINTQLRDQWLMCMRRAMSETISDEALREELRAPLEKLADHMRNQPEPQPG